jgi:hypothetical protein
MDLTKEDASKDGGIKEAEDAPGKLSEKEHGNAA